MCDEAKLKDWAKEAISRRQFGALAGAAAVAACAPTSGGEGEEQPSGLSMFSDEVSFATEDGTMDGFLVYPEQGEEYPAIIMWPDIAGVRQSKLEMAMRLASEGYAVLVVNPYYRDVAGEQFADFASFIEAEGFSKVGPWREKLTAEAIQRDAQSIVTWLDAQPQVDTSRGIGTQGYCMGGPFTVWSAAAAPSRVKAAASFHGGGLVRGDDPLSPHNTLGSATAAFLIAVAQDDDAEAPEVKTDFANAAAAADRQAKVEVYAGDHGWTVPDSPAYAEPAAEKAYADLLTLYSANL
ncbi:dienelactone hydrolase family protein [Erythrobacter crassostreae]|uniref:Dienelactone hydrolase family protein n=1 Tax=Erythrobacter crassostreae TaxID=2828328 RepID=A0A9X1F2H7_9SPHN|nr:dienelactone hydrolase family protein [Erythrobacter crassostrea]MBV7258298.1 dienelactone hydrolase family protein [Erythrobacter crassostrea]